MSSKKKVATSAVAKDVDELFSSFLDSVMKFDPVWFAEKHLTIDGAPFNLSNKGWKFMGDMYRTIALQTELGEKARPVTLCKGRQVGATILAAVLSLYFVASGAYGADNKPPIRVAHLFPVLKMMQDYSRNKLDSMIKSSIDNYIEKRGLKFDPNLMSAGSINKDSITYKQFIGMNVLRIDSTGRNGDRIRSNSLDVLLFDEFQDMQELAVEVVKKTASRSPYGAKNQGVQLYFGTPKQSGSNFERVWKSSTQMFYQLRCDACNGYFFLYNLEDDSWNDIWVEKNIVKCPHCKRLQAKEEAIDRGRWIPTIVTKSGNRIAAPEIDAEKNVIGFHFNMMLMPGWNKEVILKEWPKHNKDARDRVWNNEFLGKFFDGSNLPLTLEDIHNCALDPKRHLSEGVTHAGSKLYFMGIDWGGKDETGEAGTEGSSNSNVGQSYTAVVIISVDVDGTVAIENAWRLKKNDLEYKIDIIQRLYDAYKIHGIAADYMFGNDIVNYFQKTLDYKDKFVGCFNSGSLKDTMKYDRENIRVILNKNMIIQEIFEMIKKGKVRFPASPLSYEKIYWLFQHCTSMDLVIKTKDGNHVRVFEKGNSPNDGFMALIYSVVAYKLYVNKNKIANINDPKKTSRPAPVGASIRIGRAGV